MDSDHYLKGEPPNNRRRTDDRWWGARDRSPLLDLPFGTGSGVAWTRRGWEARKTPNELVRATFWSKGEERIITLQWMIFGEDGDWHPCNIPPGPAELE